ncbi:MAG TPA: prepilin-type N-terminal cleavage/methylation domain-containing protein [Micromonosporaceae bacterium]
MLQRIRAARQQKDRGFTLVELLIVIVILGVLAGIVVFAVQAFQSRGESAACKSDFKSVETALEAYYAQKTDYPANLTALKTDGYLREVPNTAVGTGSYAMTYVRVAPVAPATLVTYTLTMSGACSDTNT